VVFSGSFLFAPFPPAPSTSMPPANEGKKYFRRKDLRYDRKGRRETKRKAALV